MVWATSSHPGVSQSWDLGVGLVKKILWSLRPVLLVVGSCMCRERDAVVEPA